METKIFDNLVTLTLECDLLFEYFYLINNILLASAQAWIFHMNIPRDNIFLLVLNVLTNI